jgi:penicillin-binding protein 1C
MRNWLARWLRRRGRHGGRAHARSPTHVVDMHVAHKSPAAADARARTPRLRTWFLGTALVAASAGFAFWHLLPRPLFNEPLASILLARDGTLLSARIAADGQWRFPPLEAVPQRYTTALLTYEDKRFQQHIGIDPLALARAIRSDVTAARTVSGASTVTMQLARLIRAGRTSGEGADRRRHRGYRDKLLEMLLALRLEIAYSKPQILAAYASHAPFGGNIVGLEAASWRYFGRPPTALSWAEAAMLAVLPNSPALVTPGRNRAALQAKRDRLLKRLCATGVLSPQTLQLALAERLPAAPVALPDQAPHLLESLRARHPGQSRFESTLDPELQASASQLVWERADALGRELIHNVAALVVDNKSFEVLAYVGNSDGSGRNELGLAVDIVQRPRSTGSVLKPFLYAAMLDSGQLLPHMLVADVPTQYAGYAPENFDHAYRGAVPADAALAQSLNVPAVRSLKEYGVERFYDLLRDMGMSTLTRPPSDYGLTLILGGAEGTLWDITGMYANLVDTARRSTPAAPAPCRDLLVLRNSAQTLQTGRALQITPAAAWLTLNALLEAQRPAEEAHWQSFAGSRKIAWKTGTSWGFRDAWAIGNTSRFTVAVWVGNASGEGRPGLTGASAAAPLMFELQRRLAPAPWLTQPTLAMRRVQVCRDDGFLADELCSAVPEWVPSASHFERQSPHHQWVHLDASARFRVDSRCERVASMRHVAWFVLPPSEELYYRRSHADYHDLPPYRSDCDRSHGAQPMDFLYPNAAGRIYIPVELDGSKGRAVFEAVHRDRAARLYWHLDGHYVGVTTDTFHQLSLDIAPGPHLLTIVDDAGNRLSRSFEVLGTHP